MGALKATQATVGEDAGDFRLLGDVLVAILVDAIAVGVGFSRVGDEVRNGRRDFDLTGFDLNGSFRFVGEQGEGCAHGDSSKCNSGKCR